MTKTTFKLLTNFLSLLILCTFIACDTEEQPTPDNEIPVDEAEKSATDAAAMDQLTDNMEEEIYSFSVNSSGDGPCFTRTVTTSNFDMPGGGTGGERIIEIDFEDDCQAPNGMIFGGNIIYRDSLFWDSSGELERESRSVNYFDFSVNGVVMSGGSTLGWVRDSLFFTTKTKDLAFDYPNGSSSTISSNTITAQIDGLMTPNNKSDDVFSIEGTLSGVNRNGTDYEANILTPLTKRVPCNWVESGTVEFYIGAFPDPAILNYGDGTCDKIGIMTLPNGETTEVQVGQWW